MKARQPVVMPTTIAAQTESVKVAASGTFSTTIAPIQAITMPAKAQNHEVLERFVCTPESYAGRGEDEYCPDVDYAGEGA